MVDPTPPTSPLPEPKRDPSNESAATPPPAKGAAKKRRWLKILAGVVVVLLLLVVLAPSLASTGVGRSMILKIVNGNLHGKAEVADWSLGWTSGISVDGLKLLDERGDVILQASKIRTQLSLLKAMRSNFALGRTDIDNLDLTHIHIEADGVPNISKVFKPSKNKAASEPLKLSGDIHVNNMTGKVTSAGLPQILHIQPSNLSVKITSLDDPIDNDIQLAFKVEDPSRAAVSVPGSITLVGQADLFDKGVVHLDRATAKEQLTLTNVDVAAVNPFLALASLRLNVTGIASGAVNVNMQGADNQAITGELKVTNFIATGAALNDEKFASTLTVPIKIRRIAENKDANVLQVDDLRVVTDYGDVTVTANVSQELLQRISDGVAPARPGHIAVAVNFDKAAKLLRDMPKTFELLPDAKIDSARVFGQIDAWIEADRIVTKARFNLSDVAGSNKSGKIDVAPISTTIDATYLPNQPVHTLQAQLRDVAISLTSAFAKVEGGTGKDGTFAQFNLNGEADFAKLQAQLRQFSNLGQLDLQGLLKFSVNTSGDVTKPDAALDTTAKFNVTGLTIKGAGNTAAALKDQTVDATFAGLLNLSDDQIGGDIKTFSISSPQLVDVHKNDGELKLKVFTKSARLTGAGGVTVFADFKRLGDIFRLLSPAAAPVAAGEAPAGELTKGLLNGSLSFTRGDKPVTTIGGDFVADVSISGKAAPIDDKISITLKGDAPDDLTQPLAMNVDVKGTTINAGVKDAVFLLAYELPNKSKGFNGPFELLNKAKISVNIDRLDAILPILNSFSAPAAATAATKAPARASTDVAAGDDADVVKPLPPIRNLVGKLAFHCNVLREGQVTSLNDTDLDLTNLSFDRGVGHYESKDKQIDIKLTARLNTLLAAVQSIEITALAADLDAGQLKMTKPITVSNLGAAPVLTGAVELQGKLADGLRLLEALQAVKAGSKYPYTGYYVLAEDFSSQGEKVHLVGSLKASKFRAYDPKNLKTATFAEDLVTLTNDVTVTNSADPTKDIATINKLDLEMQSTGALALKISGGQLIDWTDQRKIADKLQAHLRIDWPKFWALVKPTLDPETLKSVDDLVLAGVMERDFSVGGSFPATGTDKRGQAINLSTQQSLAFLNAYGGLAFDRVSTGGVDIQKLDLPVSMEKGVVYIQDANKPKGQRYPQPFSCNGGTIDLGGLQVDLRNSDPADATRFDPHLTIPANKQIVSKVTFNPVLAHTTLGKHVNPGFANSKEASGLVNVTSVECRDLPFSWFKRADQKTSAHAASSDARAEFNFSIEKVRVDNAVVSLLVGGQVNGDIKKGSVVIEKGAVTSDIPIIINDKSTLGFAGNVNLTTGMIKTFNATVPKSLINSAALSNLPANVTRLIPENIVVPFTGSIDKPKFDLAQAVLASVTGGKGKPEDILKNLPDLLNGGKKEKK